MADRSWDNYAVARLNSACYLEALGGEWTDLRTGVPGAPISLTHEWANAWWHHHEPDWELFVLAVYDRQGRLAGVAPWARFHHEYGPLKLRRLAFVGDYRAYRVREGILTAPEQSMGVWGALLGHLDRHRSETDVLDLEALPCDLPAQIPALHAPGHWYRLQDGRIDMKTRLPDSWPEYERQQLSHGFRQRLRGRFRKLEHDYPGEVCYRQVRKPGELAPAIDALADLHRQRWHARGQHSSFDHEAFTGFHRELAAVALQRGWLRLHLIEVRGRPIAA